MLRGGQRARKGGVVAARGSTIPIGEQLVGGLVAAQARERDDARCERPIPRVGRHSFPNDRDRGNVVQPAERLDRIRDEHASLSNYNKLLRLSIH